MVAERGRNFGPVPVRGSRSTATARDYGKRPSIGGVHTGGSGERNSLRPNRTSGFRRIERLPPPYEFFRTLIQERPIAGELAA
ncbi:MAG TPA: hypothetical protein DCQ98_05335 [Planctomycetaceae bacterium]|nr:hypothetical protein [Planctomycetaceae bacterium]